MNLGYLPHDERVVVPSELHLGARVVITGDAIFAGIKGTIRRVTREGKLMVQPDRTPNGKVTVLALETDQVEVV